MARNYYSEINLHFVWHTKASLPLLTPEVEPFVHRYVKGRIINTAWAFVHEVGARKPTSTWSSRLPRRSSSATSWAN